MEQEVRLIDANKLKNHYAWWENGTAEMTLDEAKRNFDAIIGVQPTVDAVPTEFHNKCMEIEIEKRFELELKNHGHWINTYADNIKTPLVYCSVCENVVWRGEHYEYCPHCGAKMDEVKDGA